MEFYLQQKKLIKVLTKDHDLDKVKKSLTKMSFSPSDIELIMSDEAERSRQLYWARLTVNEYERKHPLPDRDMDKKVKYYLGLGLQDVLIQRKTEAQILWRVRREGPALIQALAAHFGIRDYRIKTIHDLYNEFHIRLDLHAKYANLSDIIGRYLFLGCYAAAKQVYDLAREKNLNIDQEHIMGAVLKSYNLSHVQYAIELLGITDFVPYPSWFRSPLRFPAYRKKILPIVEWFETKITGLERPNYVDLITNVTNVYDLAARPFIKWLIARTENFDYEDLVAGIENLNDATEYTILEPLLVWIYKRMKKAGQFVDYRQWFSGIFGAYIKIPNDFEGAVRRLEVRAMGTPIDYQHLILHAVKMGFVEGFRFLAHERFPLLGLRHNYEAYLEEVWWHETSMAMCLIDILRPYPIDYPTIITTANFDVHKSCEHRQKLRVVFDAMNDECVRRGQVPPYRRIEDLFAAADRVKG